VPVSLDIRTDWRVLGFSVLLCAVAAILSGLAPALQASRANLAPALKTDGLDSGSSRLRLRNTFVVGQITMSLLLLIVAGLFLRALQHAASIVPGFDQEHVDVISLDLSMAGLSDDAVRLFLRDAIERARALPGIESASATVDLPLDGGRMGLGLRLPNSRRPDGEDVLGADWNVVEPGYFKTMTIRLVQGRDFTGSDTSTAPKVAIVNEALARRAWPGEDPIGRRLIAGNPDGTSELTVIGVASDARLVSLDGAVEPYIYLPMAQQTMSAVSLVVKTRGPASAIPQVRALLRDIESQPARDGGTLPA
jgi:MacB-like periplasmic core domain